MIAVDTGSLIAFLTGSKGRDINAIRNALGNEILFLPPVVLAEVLSDIKTAIAAEQLLLIPLLEISSGYWERVGALRMRLLTRKLKASLGDAMIAQTCLDYGIELITRDRDFRHFENHCGLKIIKP